MYVCDELAVIGFEALLSRLGGPSTQPPIDDEDDPAAWAAAAEAARLLDHARVREALLAGKAELRAPELLGVRWAGVMSVTWPDRVPGLRTWAGQVTLAKIISGHQGRLRQAAEADLLLASGVYDTSKKGGGVSGLDWGTAPRSIDIGFAPGDLGAAIRCRPGVELLAIVGLECVPLVSFASRTCGFVHDGRLRRFAVEPRDGGYFYRWATAADAGPASDQE